MNRINEIETRLAAIAKELEAPDANIDALEEEVRALNAERDQLKESAKKAEELRKMIAGGAGTTKESHNAEQDQETEKEVFCRQVFQPDLDGVGLGGLHIIDVE